MSMTIIVQLSPRRTACPCRIIISMVTPNVDGSPCKTMPTESPTSAKSHTPSKICAIGVHLSRWTPLHGFAFNVRPNLTHFNNIVPCGIDDADRSVTSLSVEVGRPIELEEVKPLVKKHFQDVFNFSWAEPTTTD